MEKFDIIDYTKQLCDIPVKKETHLWEIRQDHTPKYVDPSGIVRGNFVQVCIPRVYEWTPGEFDVVSGAVWYEVYTVYNNGFVVYDSDEGKYYTIAKNCILEISTELEKPCPLCDGYQHTPGVCQRP
tara:strand:- start:23905 stop:24285 length:381 start_codon:yes stop_codon:yes gene_type:complete